MENIKNYDQFVLESKAKAEKCKKDAECKEKETKEKEEPKKSEVSKSDEEKYLSPKQRKLPDGLKKGIIARMKKKGTKKED